MQKTPIILTLAWFTLIVTALLPHAMHAERVLCGTPMECYEKAMAKLQQAFNIVETQRLENEQLQRQVAEMERKNQRLDRKVAHMEKKIAELQNRVYRYIDNGDGTLQITKPDWYG